MNEKIQPWEIIITHRGKWIAVYAQDDIVKVLTEWKIVTWTQEQRQTLRKQWKENPPTILPKSWGRPKVTTEDRILVSKGVGKAMDESIKLIEETDINQHRECMMVTFMSSIKWTLFMHFKDPDNWLFRTSVAEKLENIFSNKFSDPDFKYENYKNFRRVDGRRIYTRPRWRYGDIHEYYKSIIGEFILDISKWDEIDPIQYATWSFGLVKKYIKKAELFCLIYDLPCGDKDKTE